MDTDLLIVGAGPYGLSVAAQAQALGYRTTVLGKPMESWREAMPQGMILRSGIDWHLDPGEQWTLRRFYQERGLADLVDSPIPLELFLDYGTWFQRQVGIEVKEERVTSLRHSPQSLVAHLASGKALRAPRVVLCMGFRPFPNLEHPLAGWERVHHTNDFSELTAARGERVMIVGGRQAAFEWAVLLAEAGAAAVHVVHRHPTPEFAPSDWSWVEPYMEKTERIPGWFASLETSQQEEINQRFWREGRAKLEPWLWPRLDRPEVSLWPETELVEWDGQNARLSNRAEVPVDRVILATGFRMQVNHLDFLCPDTILAKLEQRNGFPQLSDTFESNLPGLFFTSFASTQKFGSFFGFVRGCPVTARIVTRDL